MADGTELLTIRLLVSGFLPLRLYYIPFFTSTPRQGHILYTYTSIERRAALSEYQT